MSLFVTYDWIMNLISIEQFVDHLKSMMSHDDNDANTDEHRLGDTSCMCKDFKKPCIEKKIVDCVKSK